MPGDRAATCGGPMPAIGYENHPKKGLVLVHRCEICHFIQKNKSAAKDKFQTDDLKVILNLHLQ